MKSDFEIGIYFSSLHSFSQVMSAVCQTQYALVVRGNTSFYPYFELHQTVSSFVDYVKKVLELAAECKLVHNGTDLVGTQTFEEIGIKASGSEPSAKFQIVAKDETGAWENLPVNEDPPMGPVDEVTLKIMIDKEDGKTDESLSAQAPTSSSAPSSSNSQ